jgi:hypothetical protein
MVSPNTSQAAPRDWTSVPSMSKITVRMGMS